MDHRTRLLVVVVVLLRVIGRVKWSRLGVVPVHAWACAASEVGWLRQVRVQEHRPMPAPRIRCPGASKSHKKYAP